MSPQLEIFIKALSRMFCWSASFYPQPITNWKRNSTAGLSIDLSTVNPLGFVCYAIYTSAFLYSPVIRSQYAARYPASIEPTVRFNDFAFAAHAVALCVVMYTQFWPSIWGFHVPRIQRVSWTMAGLFWGCVLTPLVVMAIVLAQSPDAGYDPSTWAWIDVIYSFSYIKLLITIVKYMPQVALNYKRQSTVGWSIGTILLDLGGGVLSMLQLVLDSSLQNDWSGITGNPVKLLLGNVTIFFDAIFCIQHYVLYRDTPDLKGTSDPGEQSPLLVGQDDAVRDRV
ncbi:unnamed protein product [Penicillium nalgiovense]|uniref:Lysosomal cystine transporter n=1 Tax=Penicillium nalgiovense TaxID=60175 RepID=A0A9W4MXE6_PENNA|nr:unnamed protein product [Penicillium nalgiovense]CAG7960837.1 unnamed protein product [Penicillium nalgiovense]CAG7986256.1 unnamed protein product [Penicillium nalgiovense]CAG8003005.1 unnamed protein product [Penicillium nalgiovense]CAG8005713.1 unnamed protein product [Penicillium nalgiovense]